MTDLSNHTVYVAHADYLDALVDELKDVSLVAGNLVFSPLQKEVCFASDIWFSPTVASFSSVSEAARLLKAAGRFWYLNPVSHIRRSYLIAEQLRKLPVLEQNFPIKEPLPEIGCFSLLDQNTLVFATKRLKNPPLGDFRFIEDRLNPPNRAYLKLWEALSLLKNLPKKGEHAIDLGASPGGWTFVMQSLGVNVLAVDKAELDKKIAALPLVKFKKESAFALDPKTLEKPVDWLLCDVACYPKRTLNLINSWITANKAKQMIITIKLQGQNDLEDLLPFKKIPNSQVLHLHHNKHEVTFFHPAPKSLYPQSS